MLSEKIASLRSSGRYIEEHGCPQDQGLCAVPIVATDTAWFTELVTPYVYESPDSVSWYAYPTTREYDAPRALAAYLIALQLEEDAARDSLTPDARPAFDTLLGISDDRVLMLAASHVDVYELDTDEVRLRWEYRDGLGRRCALLAVLSGGLEAIEEAFTERVALAAARIDA